MIKEKLKEKNIDIKDKQMLDFISLMNSRILIASASTYSLIGGVLGKNNKIYVQYPYFRNTAIEQKLHNNIFLEFIYNNPKIIKMENN